MSYYPKKILTDDGDCFALADSGIDTILTPPINTIDEFALVSAREMATAGIDGGFDQDILEDLAIRPHDHDVTTVTVERVRDAVLKLMNGLALNEREATDLYQFTDFIENAFGMADTLTAVSEDVVDPIRHLYDEEYDDGDIISDLMYRAYVKLAIDVKQRQRMERLAASNGETLAYCTAIAIVTDDCPTPPELRIVGVYLKDKCACLLSAIQDQQKGWEFIGKFACLFQETVLGTEECE